MWSSLSSAVLVGVIVRTELESSDSCSSMLISQFIRESSSISLLQSFSSILLLLLLLSSLLLTLARSLLLLLLLFTFLFNAL